MVLKMLKELKVGEKFTFKNAVIMKGVYQKKSTSSNGYCLIGKVSIKGDTFTSSENTFIETFND